jgi:hypothetical protein
MGELAHDVAGIYMDTTFLKSNEPKEIILRLKYILGQKAIKFK